MPRAVRRVASISPCSTHGEVASGMRPAHAAPSASSHSRVGTTVSGCTRRRPLRAAVGVEDPPGPAQGPGRRVGGDHQRSRPGPGEVRRTTPGRLEVAVGGYDAQTLFQQCQAVAADSAGGVDHRGTAGTFRSDSVRAGPCNSRPGCLLQSATGDETGFCIGKSPPRLHPKLGELRRASSEVGGQSFPQPGGGAQGVAVALTVLSELSQQPSDSFPIQRNMRGFLLSHLGESEPGTGFDST